MITSMVYGAAYVALCALSGVLIGLIAGCLAVRARKQGTEELKQSIDTTEKVIDSLKQSVDRWNHVSEILRKVQENEERRACLPGIRLSRKGRGRILNERARSGNFCKKAGIWCNLPDGHNGHHQFICEKCRYDRVEYTRTVTYRSTDRPVDIYKCDWCGDETRESQ